MKRIVVFAGNQCSRKREKYYFHLAYRAGRLLAENGYIVLTGGGPGLMNEVMRGAYQAGGKTIAVCLQVSGRKQTEFATEKLLYNALSDRLDKLISLGEGFVCLPGGIGTLHEIAAVLALKRKKEIDIRIPLILVDPYFQAFGQLVDRMIREGFIDRTIRSFYNSVRIPEEAVKILKQSLC